jgi:ribosomal protein S27AE
MPVRFHVAVRSEACSKCHVEHARNARFKKPTAFDHKIVPKVIQSDCARCHDASNIANHPASGVVQCGVCHDTERFTGERIDHKRVAALHCDFCPVAPASQAHDSAVAGTCYPCHTTESWQGAKATK